MNHETVIFRKSKKKQITYSLIWAAIVAGLGFALYPVNTSNKIIVFGVASTALAALAFWGVRKAAKEALCPHCSADLYEIIEAAKSVKVAVNYCLECGKKIRI